MSSSRAAKIWKRTWVGGLLTGLLALLLWAAERSASGVIVWYATLFLTLGAAVELHRMGKLRELRLGWGLIPAVLLVAFDLRAGHGSTSALELYGIAAASAFGVTLLTGGWSARSTAGGGPRPGVLFSRGLWSAGAAAWIAPPLLLLWSVWLGWGQAGLISLLILSKVGDIAGYYVGNAIGKSHPFPGISPGKTTAGCVGSFVVGTAAGGVLVATGMLGGELWGGLLAGAATNLASQAGDLLESAVKRRAGVKDSGTWFGPSGGVLDLVDSLLLSVPVALATWPLFLQ
jgi:CDP-diglyceride synthetase